MHNLRTCAPVLARVWACDTQAHVNVNRHTRIHRVVWEQHNEVWFWSRLCVRNRMCVTELPLHSCFSPRLLQGWSQVEQAGRLQLPSSVNRGEPRQSDLDRQQEWSVWYNLVMKGPVNRTREINCSHSALLQNMSRMLWLNRPVEAQRLIGCVWSSASQQQMAVPAGQDGARRLRNGMMPLRPD